jgi:hypothetical protein
MPDPMKNSSPLHPGPYEIRIKERIDEKWLTWFDEFTIARAEKGETLLTGSIRDQAALHGLLARIRDLNLTLISVNRIEKTGTTMRNKSLAAYLMILAILCAGFVIGARAMGAQGVYLAGGYMVTPAIAALITRLLFHKPRFGDAFLRFGRVRDYIRFWLYSLGITALGFILFTLAGSIRWDFSGKIFLDQLAGQFAATGENMLTSLPPGFTPQMMLWLFVVGGLTVFNILPGVISGFGEEFGHRGFMFPLLSQNRPWLGLLLGGFVWYLWHQPLALIIPTASIILPRSLVRSARIPISATYTPKAGASSSPPLPTLQ